MAQPNKKAAYLLEELRRFNTKLDSFTELRLLKLAEESIESGVDAAIGWAAKGIISAIKQNINETILCFNKALELSKASVIIHNYARALSRVGLFDQAVFVLSEYYGFSLNSNLAALTTLFNVATLSGDHGLAISTAESLAYKSNDVEHFRNEVLEQKMQQEVESHYGRVDADNREAIAFACAFLRDNGLPFLGVKPYVQQDDESKWMVFDVLTEPVTIDKMIDLKLGFCEAMASHPNGERLFANGAIISIEAIA